MKDILELNYHSSLNEALNETFYGYKIFRNRCKKAYKSIRIELILCLEVCSDYESIRSFDYLGMRVYLNSYMDNLANLYIIKFFHTSVQL